MDEKTVFSFPGLGIDWHALNKVAFSIGKIEVRWYGILITCGILLAFLYVSMRGKKNEGIVPDDVIDVGLLTVILGILGARLYYVLTTLDTHQYKNLLDVFAIWNGGLAIYGGIIGGCLGILIMCLIKKISWLKLFDMAAPGVMIAQALGRWGNFFNGEAYGYAIGDTTKFYFFDTEHVLQSGEGTFFHTLRMGLYNGYFKTYYHPTFLYESLWNLLGFVLINIFYKHKKFDGQIALMYFTWYGFGRMFIEGLRTDSLYIPGTTLRISQCLGLFFFLTGLTLLIVFSILKRNDAPVLAAVAAKQAEENAAEEVFVDPCETAEDACDSDPAFTSEEEQTNTETPDTETQPTDTEEDQNGKAD